MGSLVHYFQKFKRRFEGRAHDAAPLEARHTPPAVPRAPNLGIWSPREIYPPGPLFPLKRPGRGSSSRSDGSESQLTHHENDSQLDIDGAKLENKIGNLRTNDYVVRNTSVLRGGSYNCVVKADITPRGQKGDFKTVVFRAARSDGEDSCVDGTGHPIRGAAVVLDVLYRRNFRTFGVPKLLEYDVRESKENPARTPYCMIDYVQGVRLEDIIDELPLTHRLALARAMVAAKAEMESFHFQKIGRLAAVEGVPDHVAYPGDVRLPAKLSGLPTYWRDEGNSRNIRIPPKKSSFRDFVFTQLESWEKTHKLALRSEPAQEHLQKLDLDLKCRLWKEVRRVAQEMDERGWLDLEGPNVLHHWDLYTRNIIVKVSPATVFRNPEYTPKPEAFLEPEDPELIRIAAIIDWDDAASRPLALSRSPFSWLWNHHPSISDDLTEELPVLQQDDDMIKRHFDYHAEKAMPGYARDAYGEKGVLLRNLTRLLVDGIFPTGSLDTIKSLSQRWTEASKATHLLSPESQFSESEPEETEIEDEATAGSSEYFADMSKASPVRGPRSFRPWTRSKVLRKNTSW